MAKVLYLDRAGERISQEAYKAHRADPDYTQVRAYDNNRVRAKVEWVGRIENPQNVYAEFYKLFCLDVWNYTSGGELARDPLYPQFFPDEASAVKAYDAFVVRWSDSELDDEGVLIEAGNTLLPPPPPNPDAPQSAPLDDDVAGVGAW